MSKTFFIDRLSVKGSATRTAEGYVIADAAVTRTGIFIYYDQSGKQIRVLRKPDDVFNEISMNSLKLKPITNNHPSNKKLLNKTNAKDYLIGSTGENVHHDETTLFTSLIIYDGDTIDNDIANGKLEFSCGYDSMLIQEAGIFDGQEYDFIQSDISYNHVALVGKGRAGSDIRLNFMDSETYTIFNKRKIMNKKIVLDSVEYEVPEQVEVAFGKALSENKTLKTSLDSADGKIAALTEDNATKQAIIDSMPIKIADGIKARRELETKLSAIFDSEDGDISGLSDSELIAKACTKVYPNISLDGKSPDFINGILESAIVTINDSGDALAIQRSKLNQQSKEFTDSCAKTAREKMIDKMKNNHKAKTA